MTMILQFSSWLLVGVLTLHCVDVASTFARILFQNMSKEMSEATAAKFLEKEFSPGLPQAGDDVSRIFGKECMIESNTIAFQLDASKGTCSDYEHSVIDVDFGATPALDLHVSCHGLLLGNHFSL